MKFFVISILLWKDKKDNHKIKDFLNTCKEEQKYIFFRNRQTDKNSIPYKRDIVNLNSIKKDDIVFLRVRLKNGNHNKKEDRYKYYSFGKFINLENINSHESFNNYIQHKKENFQLVDISNIITNFEGIRIKKEVKAGKKESTKKVRIFEILENKALNIARAITKNDNFNFSNYTMKYWVISPNVLADKKEHPIQNFIDMMEKDKVALMGWKENKPLGKKFESDVKLGDIIIISLRVNWKRKDYFVGIVDSDSYHYEYQNRYIQARKLKYFTHIKEKISWNENCTSESIQSPPAIYELNENNEYDNKIMKEFLNILNIKMDNAMEKYINILKENYNFILTGAPGTGKTYLAKQIAAKIIFDNNIEYTEDLEDDDNFKNQCKFVQFHPSYDYTDFVEGLRPIKDSNGNIMFERKDGVFKEFCKNALQNRSSKFVFIIDEINRGEISKIFGELFFAIDTGYRGEIGRVKTQYNNLISNDEADDEFEDGFFVPENVYIIGTMNDIDRSVESMDFAMRRRFAWKEIKAKDTQYMLDNILDNEVLDEAKERMNKLNKAIEKIEGFNSSYHIGASYFLKLKNYYNGGNIEEAFNSLWENHLRGLLYEYLRGMPDAESKLEELKSL